MIKALRKFAADEKGLETVEYAVMTALIVAALVTAVGAMVAAVNGRFGEITDIVDAIN